MTDLLTLDEVAGILRVSTRTVQRAISQRGLRAVQVAGDGRCTWRVRPADLEEWLEQRASVPEPRPVDVTPIAVAAARAGRRPRRGGGTTGGRVVVRKGMGR